MHPPVSTRLAAFERLLQIMNDLREKCPWDRKQTLETLRLLTIEETYELADAITANDLKNLEEELGDLLLHIVFYAKIGEEQDVFDIESIMNKLCDKLIRRHPHIYGNVQADSVEAVLNNWEKIKLQEKSGSKKSVLQGVPVALPALPKALRIQEKAAKVGFEWDTKEQVWDKVLEEINELAEAVAKQDAAQQHQEFGDVLFALANYARFINIDPENALNSTNHKFIRRFQEIERIAQEQNKNIEDMSLTEMDAIWNEIKAKEKH